MTVTARAVGVTRPGGREVLRVVERSVREPNRGEVRLWVGAAAVNPTDINLRERGIEELDPPWVVGREAAGTVDAVGKGVERLVVGDAVMAVVDPRRPEGGAQAERVVVPANSVVAIPEGATIAQASTLPMNGLTALLGLKLLDLREGQVLAVSGGAGVLASYAIALAKTRGLRVFADARAEDERLVLGFGADVVLQRGACLAAEIRAQAPDGVDGFFDTAMLGRSAFPAIRDGGALIAVRPWTDGDTERGIKIRPVLMTKVAERTDWLEQLRNYASQGTLQLRVAATFSPKDAAEAHRLMEAGGLRGRAVITF
jgi:NADPH:quinone reductase